MKIRSKKAGFTLLEVLLVIVIISILATIVLVAINPGRQIAMANNTKRYSDVKTILDAVHQYSIEQAGQRPSVITGTPTNIGSGVGEIDICSDIVPMYVSGLPADPLYPGGHFSDCSDYSIGYQISISADNRVVIDAPYAELGEVIGIAR